MAFEMNDNSGSMFVNERKTTAKHPDRNGSCKINGVEYWVSGWIKESKKEGGKPWLSMSFTPKEQQSSGSSAPSRRMNNGVDDGFDDSDVPF